MNRTPIRIRYFTWDQWIPLNILMNARLAEDAGIVLDPDDIPEEPEDTPEGSPEWDTDHIDQVYLSGSGGFWLAWHGDKPVGNVGAQDLGGVVELRRMYVLPEYRRQGVGTLLVCTLIRHCRMAGARAIEVWTAFDGPGRHLYRRLGFRQVAGRGPEFEQALQREEMRLRLDL